jgi:hypothetical protein
VHVLSRAAGLARVLNPEHAPDVAEGVTTTAAGSRPAPTTAVDISLRVFATAALGISAYVHLHLAGHPFNPAPGTLTQARMFYAQGVVAAVVALALLVTGNRFVWWAAAAVGAASFAAVLLYTYVDVGKIGPLPNMNDPGWLPSPEKSLSAVAEAAVVVGWLAHEVVRRTRR